MEFDPIEKIFQYKNILLDVGGTLVNIKEPFETYTQRAIEYLFNFLGLAEHVRDKFLLQAYQLRIDIRKKSLETEIEITIEDYIQTLLNIFNIQYTPEFLSQCEKIYIQSEKEVTDLYQDTIPFLKKLAAEKKKVLIATNNFSIKHVHEIFQRFDLEKYHQGCYISGKIDYRKPNIKFLSQIIESEKIDKDDTILIGDRLEIDVLAAIQSGIHSCWLNRNNISHSPIDPIPEYIIKNLVMSKCVF